MATIVLSPNGVDEFHLDAQPDTLLAATMDGVVELQSTGGEWRFTGRSLTGRHASCLALDSRTGTAFAGTHGDGFYRRSTTDGEWERSDSGLDQPNIFSLACLTGSGDAVLYAGTEPAHLFRSTDGGRTWHELDGLRRVPGRDGWNFPAPPHIAHVKHIDVDARDPCTIYVSIEQGALLKSTDAGATFTELAFQDDTYVLNKDVHRVVMNAHDRAEMYVPGGDGITYTSDGGQSWSHRATPKMRIAYPDAMFCSPETDGTVYATGGGTSPDVWRSTGDARSTVARSRDHGQTWEALPLPSLRGNIEAATLVTWPGGYGFFAGTTDGEIFASTDRGESWTQIAAGLPPISKCIHHRNLSLGRGAA
jgi:photosystem II stability/assembly factor-like uncharacterized protein